MRYVTVAVVAVLAVTATNVAGIPAPPPGGVTVRSLSPRLAASMPAVPV